MLELKIDVLQELKERGFSSYYLRKNNLIGEKTLTDLRAGRVPGIKSLETICDLLECQPGDIIRRV